MKKFVQLALFCGIARFKNEVALLVNVDKQKKRKRKYTSLLIKYLQTASQPWQCDAVLWQSEAIAKWRRFFLFSANVFSSKTPYFNNSLAINTIKTKLFYLYWSILPLFIAPTSQAWSVLRPRAIFFRTDPKKTFYGILRNVVTSS